MGADKGEDKSINRPIECKGCYATKLCDVQPTFIVYKCPCVTCVVKVMCSHMCDEYSHYVWLNVEKKYKEKRGTS